MPISNEIMPVAIHQNIHNSAGVYVKEDDRSATLPLEAQTISIGAIVGGSAIGPVNQPTFVTNSQEFIKIYGMPDPNISMMHYSALAFLEVSEALWVNRVAESPQYAGLTVSLEGTAVKVDPNDARWGGSGTAAQIEQNGGNPLDPDLLGKSVLSPANFPFQPNDLFILYGISTGAEFNAISVDIIPATDASIAAHAFYINVYQNNVFREKFLVTLNDNYIYAGKQCEIESRINNAVSGSQYIRCKQNQQATAFLANPAAKIVKDAIFDNDAKFFGGSSGISPSTALIVEGWQAFRSKELVDVNILINGGYTDRLVHMTMESIAKERSDCFAILDMPTNMQAVSDAVTYRNNRNPFSVTSDDNVGLSMYSASGAMIDKPMDSTYAAIYTPDVLILDRNTDRRMYVPPSGYIAAAYANTDKNYSTWFSPAGMNRGKINVLGLRYDYSQKDRDILTDNQINPIRLLAGRGIRIWGADTLKRTPSALSNINVRRLLIFLERIISSSALYSVFDPNDETLRENLTEMCNRFLKPIKNARGLYDFKVICNESNNTNEDIAAGDLNLDVYLDPILPAKRIHLTATINRTGVRFTGG